VIGLFFFLSVLFPLAYRYNRGKKRKEKKTRYNSLNSYIQSLFLF
jgi:hypothetical protein